MIDRLRSALLIVRNLRGFNLLFVICVATLSIRTILDSSFRHSALLYVLIPFALSILLQKLSRPPQSERALWRYLHHMRDATIVMLATSAFLFEGFFCVLMFMPIYYFLSLLPFCSIFTLNARSIDKTVSTYTLCPHSC